MDQYRELANNLKGFGGKTIHIEQGIVKSCEGTTCHVEIGDIVIPDVRLRASLAAEDNHLLIVPAIGSAVIVGSLSGDLSELVVLAIDRADKIIINGGRLGGLINIDNLTHKLNELVHQINSHTHISSSEGGPTSAPTQPASKLDKNDYEDTKVTH